MRMLFVLAMPRRLHRRVVTVLNPVHPRSVVNATCHSEQALSIFSSRERPVEERSESSTCLSS